MANSIIEAIKNTASPFIKGFARPLGQACYFGAFGAYSLGAGYITDLAKEAIANAGACFGTGEVKLKNSASLSMAPPILCIATGLFLAKTGHALLSVQPNTP